MRENFGLVEVSFSWIAFGYKAAHAVSLHNYLSLYFKRNFHLPEMHVTK